MRKFYLLFISSLVALISLAQVVKTAPDGGGKISIEPGEVTTPEQRMAIIGMLKRNTTTLEQKGILSTNKNNQNRKALGRNRTESFLQSAFRQRQRRVKQNQLPALHNNRTIAS